MINDKEHGSLLQDSVSQGKRGLRDLFPMNIVSLENLFDLWDTYIKTTNNLSWKYETIKEDTIYL